MKFIKTFFLLIFFLILVVYGLIFILNLSLEKTLFNIEYYHELNTKFNVFEQIHDSFDFSTLGQDEEKEVVDTDADDGAPEHLKNVFNTDWLEEQFFFVLENVLDYINGEQDSLSVKIDLSDRIELMEEYLPEDIDDGGQDEDFLPEEINLEDLLGVKQLGTVLSGIALFRSYMPYIPYIIFAFFFLFMALLSGFSGGLKWFGSGMLVSGILAFILFFTLNLLTEPSFLQSFFEIQLGFEFLFSLLAYTISEIIFIPILYLLIGLFLLFLGILLGVIKKRF